MTSSATEPPAGASDRVQRAIRDRPSTDYVFHFWTALGWTFLTFGLYWFYVFYQLMRRARDHDRRRADLLSAALDLAWQQATEQDRAEALRPSFESVQVDIEPLRTMAGDLRDPTLWLLASIIGNGLVWLAGALLLDQDLVRHEHAERDAEAGITSLFAKLGTTLPTPVPAAKQPHNYVGRILALVFSLGAYSLWWVADIMRDGNTNYQQGYAWEDALGSSLGGAASIAA